MSDEDLNFEDFLNQDLAKDPILVKEILQDEISEYQKTGDITYVLKNLGRIVAMLGFPYFEEKTDLTRATIYGVIKNKLPTDISIVNKLLKAINFKEI